MVPQQRRRLSSAHVISLLSLFVALSGWGYAASTAGRNTVTSKSVKNDALKGKDVKDDSLTGNDVNESTLKGIQGPPGAQGDPGPQGQTGLQGPPGLSSGPAGGVLTGTYPNPGLAPAVVAGANLVANLGDVLDIDDIASQGVDEDELSDDLGDTIDENDIALNGVGSVEIVTASVGETELSNDLADTIDTNDIATNGVGVDEIGLAAVGARELRTLTIETSTVVVPGGGAEQNGNMDTRSATATCPLLDQKAIGGGATWVGGAANDAELYLVENRPAFPTGWFARGGNDTGSSETFQVQVICLNT